MCSYVTHRPKWSRISCTQKDEEADEDEDEEENQIIIYIDVSDWHTSGILRSMQVGLSFTL